ncbi:putative nuclear hormone receptor HR3 [Frankliniella fusca]|uniref:Nuclear hormone receptor HR3 n=1 Tax=Frankliniella fusca TaxID=407009 RepID=A0AAE1HUS1_9NEOP|nr:putative nuclear hormone receptor HR3 [Frankliniella fusca]
MSRDAVKFGRMSKKQREKVEDEVRYHRAQQRAQTETAPDSSVFDQQTPSSSDQLQYGGYGYTSEVGSYGSSSHGYSGYGQVAQHAGMQYDISADYVDYVDSTTAYDPRPTPGTPSVDTPATDSALMPSAVTTGKQTSLATNTPHLSQHHHLPHQGQGQGPGPGGQPPQQQAPAGGGSGGSGGSAQSSQRVAATRPASSNSSTLVAVKQDPEELGELGSSTVTGYVDSTTYPSPAPAPAPAGPSGSSAGPDCSPLREAEVAPSHPNPAQISELLSKTIADAHARTCLFTLEHIHDMFRKPQDLSKLIYYKDMAHEELWLECAQKLTTVIQQIIEFAKMVPGFMKLHQDDQIVLLKAGSFELAILRMSRYYDLSQNCVLYAETMLPQDAFYTNETAEMRLVNFVFDFARSIAEMKLTETELALYSAVVLLSPDRPGLKGIAEITRLSQAVQRALRIEMDRTHPQPIKGDVTVCDAMLAKIPVLRDLSMLHMDALAKFKRSTPHLEFPALHKELFSVDS